MFLIKERIQRSQPVLHINTHILQAATHHLQTLFWHLLMKQIQLPLTSIPSNTSFWSIDSCPSQPQTPGMLSLPRFSISFWILLLHISAKKKSLQCSIHENCARLAQLCRLLAQRIISRAQKLSMKAAYTTKFSHPYKHMLKVLSSLFSRRCLGDKAVAARLA